jgi:hypothetical protein
MNYRLLAAAALVCATALGNAACGDDDGPTPLPTTFIFTSQLLPSNEVPPVTNADASATGTLNMTMTVTRDSGGGITAATTVFVVTMAGFPANTTLSAAHIHNNVAGQTGGIFVDAGLGSVSLATGTGSVTTTAPATSVAQAEAIIANPPGYYFNVHTTLNPGGAIRGQLTLQSSSRAIRY